MSWHQFSAFIFGQICTEFARYKPGVGRLGSDIPCWLVKMQIYIFHIDGYLHSLEIQAGHEQKARLGSSLLLVHFMVLLTNRFKRTKDFSRPLDGLASSPRSRTRSPHHLRHDEVILDSLLEPLYVTGNTHSLVPRPQFK